MPRPPMPPPKTIAGTRMRVDWPRLISGNNIELHNLAADPAHRQPLERLFAALKQWSADTQDTSTPLPLKP